MVFCIEAEVPALNVVSVAFKINIYILADTRPDAVSPFAFDVPEVVSSRVTFDLHSNFAPAPLNVIVSPVL